MAPAAVLLWERAHATGVSPGRSEPPMENSILLQRGTHPTRSSYYASRGSSWSPLGGRVRWFKASVHCRFLTKSIPTRSGRPAVAHCFSVSSFITVLLLQTIIRKKVARPIRCPDACDCDLVSYSHLCGLEKITLSGGSLGSCVDEERSQLRELM